MSSVFTQALTTMLRPIVKIMLKNGVDVAQFTSLVRATYVSVAQDDDFALEGANGKKRKITHSRIAVLTGINRKEIKQIIDSGELAPRRTTTNRAVRVISGWVDNPRFQDKGGEPKTLSYGKDTTQASFEELVHEYSADTTARVILDELRHVGSIHIGDDGQVNLVEKGYIPRLSDEKMMEIGCRAISDLSKTVDYNVHRPKDIPDRLQMMVHYDDVPRQGVALYRSVLKPQADEFLAQQNLMLKTFDRSVNPDVEGTGRYRVGIGLYYFEEPFEE